MRKTSLDTSWRQRPPVRIALLAAAFVVAVTSCAWFAPGERAILVLSFSPQLTAKTIQPDDFSMEVDHYVVRGSGPDESSFSDTVGADGTVVRSSLIPGEWTITVEAYNAPEPNGVKIGEGEILVVLRAGEVLQTTVTVDPVVGTGVLDIGVSWPDDVLTDPVLEATLAPRGTTPAPDVHGIVFSPDGAVTAPRIGVRHTDGAVETGYYTLSLILLDQGSVPVWGTVEAVRIIEGQTSAEDYELVRAVNRSGSDLTIDPALQNPVTIEFDVPEEGTAIPAGQSLVVTADVSEPVSTYRWFLNGAPEDQADESFLVPDNLPPGFYWLDLMVTQDDAVLSSAGIRFQVVSVGTVIGPVVDPPGVGSYTQTGAILGKEGGVTFEFTGIDLDQTSLLMWGPDAGNPPGLAFDRSIDEAGETLVFDSAASDFAAGVARFTGEADFTYYELPSSTTSTVTLPSRLTITVTDPSGQPIPLEDSAVYGISDDVGAVAVIEDDFSVNLLIESYFRTRWQPSVDMYDIEHTPPDGAGAVITTFTGGFYYVH